MPLRKIILYITWLILIWANGLDVALKINICEKL